MKINSLVFYHKNETNLLSKQKSKFLDIQGFVINFYDSAVRISFNEIKINYYCLELSFMITKISTYYQFFPEWLDYHLDYRFMIDNNKRENLIIQQAKINNVDINFNFISIEIKENIIATCSVFDADLNSMNLENPDKKSVKNILKQLKSIKKDYSSVLIVKNFTLRIYDYYENSLKFYPDKINFEENFIYFDNIIRSITSLNTKNSFLIYIFLYY